MQTPLISIIIPCYNGELFIKNAIRSCIQETYQNVEIIVIDDGSKDSSKKIIKELVIQFPQIKPIFQDNKGVCAARNAGLEIANGEFYIFLDADDILLPNSIYHFVNKQRQSNTDIVLGLTTLHSKDGKLLSDFSFFEYTKNPMASLIKKWWPICSAMVRRSDKKWDEKLKVWEVEEYFFILLLECNFSCSFIDQYVSQINNYENEHKVSTVYDHYEAINTAKYFTHLGEKLKHENKLDDDVIEALNYNIMNFTYQTVRNGLVVDKEIYQGINRSKLISSPKFKITGLTGWCYLFGVERGMKWFLKANKLKDFLKNKG